MTDRTVILRSIYLKGLKASIDWQNSYSEDNTLMREEVLKNFNKEFKGIDWQDSYLEVNAFLKGLKEQWMADRLQDVVVQHWTYMNGHDGYCKIYG